MIELAFNESFQPDILESQPQEVRTPAILNLSFLIFYFPCKATTLFHSRKQSAVCQYLYTIIQAASAQRKEVSKAALDALSAQPIKSSPSTSHVL